MRWKVTRIGPSECYPFEDCTTYVLIRGDWQECPSDWLPQDFLLSCMEGKIGKGKSKSYDFEEEDSSPQ